MMKFASLFSGSSGNCLFAGNEHTRILIDAGGSLKQVGKCLNSLDEHMKDIDAVLITHEHIDHIRGLKVLLKHYPIPVYISALTAERIAPDGFSGCVRIFEQLVPFRIGDMEITPFPLSHDAVEPSGFRILFGDGRSIGVATDTGCLSDEILKGITGADIVCIESNYDENMLKAGSYPYFLKRRILSDRGHLSNDDCALLAFEAVRKGAKKILLSHLSCENNLPDLAYMTTDQRLTKESVVVGGDVELAVSPRFSCSKVFTF